MVALGQMTRSCRTRGGYVPIPGSEILPYLYNSSKPGTLTGIPGSIPLRGNPDRIGWLLTGRGSWSPRAARVSPRDNVEDPPHPGRIASHPRIRNPSISLQLTPTNGGQKRGTRGSIPPRTVWKPQPEVHRTSATRGDRIPSPDQKSFHTNNSNKPETQSVVFRVDTAPHGVETPTPLADC